MSTTVLKGITWGHSRGYVPLVAAAQRYRELHPDVIIHWDIRSLQEFADFPIEKLTETYDLLIIDHPWVGCAAATNCVLPLNNFLPKSYLKNQLENSVGGSHQSYNYNNQQWALAIDAATPVASCRLDLLLANNQSIPSTWNEVLAFAQKGKVAVPAIPIDLLMNFYTFCIAHQEVPFQNFDEVVSLNNGILALETMYQLYSLVHKNMFNCNPIAIAELMTNTDEYWYCPFAYCYSNYSRNGYAKNILTYTNVVSYNNALLHTTIGGTGIAVSAFSNHQPIAIDFAQWVTSSSIQQTLYVQNGGQPGHKAAWLSNEANLITNHFFTNCLPTMQNGFIRPRYNGYLHFQDEAGLPIQNYLKGNETAKNTILKMNQIYQTSLQLSKTTNEL